MKIAVIADAHANLPALEAALQAITAQGCDLIFHLGDAIAIGPFPAECVDLLYSTPNLKCVLGNHELYFVDGLPEHQPAWMSDGEVCHQHWTHRQLGDQRIAIISQWPFIYQDVFEGVKAVFLHYGLVPLGRDFTGVIRNPNEADLDKIFFAYQADIVFFGHDHSPSDTGGKARYINPGSLGCSREAFARYTIAVFENNRVDIHYHQVGYDDTVLVGAFEDRNVPEREFIYRMFFGDRFRV